MRTRAICNPACIFASPAARSGDVHRLGFYTRNEIKPEFLQILARRDHIRFDQATAQRLRDSSSPEDVAIGEMIDRLRGTVLGEGDEQRLFLLSPANDPRTLLLPNRSATRRALPVVAAPHGQGQRYISSAALVAGPATTDELAGFR